MLSIWFTKTIRHIFARSLVFLVELISVVVVHISQATGYLRCYPLLRAKCFTEHLSQVEIASVCMEKVGSRPTLPSLPTLPQGQSLSFHKKQFAAIFEKILPL